MGHGPLVLFLSSPSKIGLFEICAVLYDLLMNSHPSFDRPLQKRPVYD